MYRLTYPHAEVQLNCYLEAAELQNDHRKRLGCPRLCTSTSCGSRTVEV